MTSRDNIINVVEYNAAPDGSLEEQRRGLPLFEYWLFLKRRWYIPVLCAGIAMGAVWFRSLSHVPKYTAFAALMIDTVTPQVLETAQVYDIRQSWDTARFYGTQHELLRSPLVAESVVRKLALVKPEASDDEVTAAALDVLGSLRVASDKDHDVVGLYFTHENPEMAARGANAFVEAYLEVTREKKQRHATEAIRFLGEQIQVIRDRLDKAELALGQYYKSNDIPGINFEEGYAGLASPLAALRTERTTLYAEKIRMETLLFQLKRVSADGVLPSLSKEGEYSTTVMVSLQERRAQLSNELTQLKKRYGPRHPQVVEREAALANIDAGLHSETSDMETQIDARLQALTAAIKVLDGAIAGETTAAVALRGKEAEHARLQREVLNERELLQTVTHRLKETELTRELTPSNGWQVSHALVPGSPNPVPFGLFMIMAAVGGVLAGLALGYGVEYVDDRLRSADELEYLVGQPLLGVVPHIREKDVDVSAHGGLDQFVLNHPRSPVAEDFHHVATSLSSLFLKRAPRTLVVTSPCMEDGKSLFSIGLASVFAERGRKVLLVDADLRRGRLHATFDVPRAGGLYDILVGEKQLSEAKRASGQIGLDLIPTGEVPPKVNPVRVLELDDLKGFIDKALLEYDMVIFDTPPATAVSDVQIIGHQVDGVVCLARHNKTSRRAVRAMTRQFTLAKLPVVACVMTDVAHTAYGYYRAYGYGYGYGYGVEDEPEAESA